MRRALIAVVVVAFFPGQGNADSASPEKSGTSQPDKGPGASPSPTMFIELADIVANRRNLGMTSSDLVQALAKYGPFKQLDEVVPGDRVFRGQKNSWGTAELFYELDERNVSRLKEMSFHLPDPASEMPVFNTLYEALRSRLGKPLHQKKANGKLSAAAWKLSQRQGVWLIHDSGRLPGEKEHQSMTTLSAGDEAEEVKD